jgi:hypothetical protein
VKIETNVHALFAKRFSNTRGLDADAKRVPPFTA